MSTMRFFSLLAIIALLTACAGQSVAPGEGAPYIQSQKQHARALKQKGRLAESLAFWRSILPADKHDKEAKQEIAALEKQISENVRKLTRKAQSAYKAGSTRQGDTYALKILALQPGNQRAIDWLVASTTKRAQAQARSKTQQEYSVASPQPAPIEKQPTSAPQTQKLEQLLAQKDYAAVIASADPASSPRAAGLLRSAYIGQGEQAIAANDTVAAITSFRAAIKAQPVRNDPLITRIRTLQQEASDTWYREGRRVLNADIDAAIAAFSKAVEIKPDHQTAQSALKRAQTLKRNLEKIENR